MTFNEAIALVFKGKKMRRPSWVEKSYISMGGIYDSIFYHSNSRADIYDLNLDDYEANDWKVYEGGNL